MAPPRKQRRYSRYGLSVPVLLSVFTCMKVIGRDTCGKDESPQELPPATPVAKLIPALRAFHGGIPSVSNRAPVETSDKNGRNPRIRTRRLRARP